MVNDKVYTETLKAFNQGYRYIANEGGTRSSKTFSVLRILLNTMLYSSVPLVITVVSHSFPHLFGGAIRDFEIILNKVGIIPETVRVKNPHIYTIKKSIIEFVGFDRPNKSIGAARDILFINEGNFMSFKICHQLIQRTRGTVFIDWNPSEVFWFDAQGYRDRKDCKTIHSTFKYNINHLSKDQLEDFVFAKQKADEEKRKGIKGYWWNWWRVYGLGLRGMLEGVIFQDWRIYKTLPANVEYFRLFGVDWGGVDPTVVVELNIDPDRNYLYIKQHLYQPQILNDKIIELILKINSDNDIVVCDPARADKIFELQVAGIAAVKAQKGKGSIVDGIERMLEMKIFIHKNSTDVQDEFTKYKRVKDETTGKYLNIPVDENNHSIDSTRYGVRYYRQYIKPAA